MLFLEHQPKEQVECYNRLLKAVGSLSKLFSEAPEPYLAYRAAENLFCKAFIAENLSRSDASADASKDRVGIGLKTFLNGNGRSLQKVAEFNNDLNLFRSLGPEDMVRKVAELRNERLETTKRIYNLDKIIYHCVTRTVGKMLVYETPAHPIDIETIKNVEVSPRGNTITFSDSLEEYSFSISKSTLSKRFVTPEKVLLELPVRIVSDPFEEVEKLITEAGPIFAPIKVQPHVFLPLYSMRGEKRVPESSGLNQWNARGRKRNPDEVYIPIPAWVHKKFSKFFPATNDEVFNLTLPDRTVLSASMCQENRKALMSNPNTVLGKWILRDVMNLGEGELATYEKLQTMGVDSVVVYKVDSENYDIDFAPVGSYEKFLEENNKPTEGAEDYLDEEGE
ncbi:NgoFVII family restriction endonuclease [Candidatus Adlerbacteria bacterium RIFOXYC1_FULL_48_26]|uniref:NgoFVII family restriction endonuclease n=1 Tax=Candidatus Adlerbacteria bacterium RIFOXYC1_FULL_48_26 TaxID=1797247 RepID=A0A1F4Y455_9BACT|nr:MAG: NgoFVII family restriction endonuclease [Candidatus Adlerbacteria bacterium RIFOXYC1_FULL_48_26]OGC94347.1 MAG: NgoFVII family restriction endonuclease [Candidatus Adlerbacteria bacterium RIFOXYB1_FULL_48_10]